MLRSKAIKGNAEQNKSAFAFSKKVDDKTIKNSMMVLRKSEIMVN